MRTDIENQLRRDITYTKRSKSADKVVIFTGSSTLENTSHLNKAGYATDSANLHRLFMETLCISQAYSSLTSSPQIGNTQLNLLFSILILLYTLPTCTSLQQMFRFSYLKRNLCSSKITPASSTAGTHLDNILRYAIDIVCDTLKSVKDVLHSAKWEITLLLRNKRFEISSYNQFIFEGSISQGKDTVSY